MWNATIRSCGSLCFVQVGLNFYLALIARSFYVRYEELADELRDTFTSTSSKACKPECQYERLLARIRSLHNFQRSAEYRSTTIHSCKWTAAQLTSRRQGVLTVNVTRWIATTIFCHVALLIRAFWNRHGANESCAGRHWSGFQKPSSLFCFTCRSEDSSGSVQS